MKSKIFSSWILSILLIAFSSADAQDTTKKEPSHYKPINFTLSTLKSDFKWYAVAEMLADGSIKNLDPEYNNIPTIRFDIGEAPAAKKLIGKLIKKSTDEVIIDLKWAKNNSLKGTPMTQLCSVISLEGRVLKLKHEKYIYNCIIAEYIPNEKLVLSRQGGTFIYAPKRN